MVISRRGLFGLLGSVAVGSAAAVVVGPPSGVVVSAAALRASIDKLAREVFFLKHFDKLPAETIVQMLDIAWGKPSV